MKRLRAGFAAAIALLVAAAAAGSEPVAPPDADRAAAGNAEALASRIAAPWPALQLERGVFRDYMDVRPSQSRDKYGSAVLGHALLQTGVRSGDDRLVSAGLRALVRSAEAPRPYHSIVFEKAALAAGYNLARRSTPGHPAFVSGRPAIERRLQAMAPTWIGQSRAPYFNQFLVDAIMILELERSGQRSSVRGAVLTDPVRHIREVERLVNRTLPALARSQTTSTRRAGSLTLATDGPLAYHALTLAYTARVMRLLGDRAGKSSRELLQRLARATWAFGGPDGDLAYFGRSHQQSWALSLTAYGMEVAAQAAAGPWAPRFRAVARRALGRLGSLHVGGPYGLHLTPAFRRGLAAGAAAQDSYVSGTAYTGLTLEGLEWLAEVRRPGAIGRVAADAPLAFRLGAGAGSFTVVSTGRVWYVVRQRPGSLGDLRSGAGLVALKVRDARGEWRDALPQRPISGGGEDSAGPVLRRGGLTALPYGRSLRVQARASVRWTVDMRRPGNGALVRRAALVLRPSRCGVRMTIPVLAGDRFEASVFLPATPGPRRAGRRAVVGGNVRAAYTGAGHIATGGAFSGAIDGPLVRSRLSARGFSDGTRTFSFSSRGHCARR